MKILVNNKEKESKAQTLTLLIEELGLPSVGLAVAVNNRMVPRTQWDTYALAEGMSIVIIKAACGG
ncbi:MAG: sulfur carrier protein ThiS [Paraprevotella sp.]|jgi:thiamine biosynthesis protein thiS|nr:sulfur carrier protein ThiS [Paraprevotella sp.]MBP3471828.1 sulfur carrier protein ThiS [Paraprevotella sp.]